MSSFFRPLLAAAALLAVLAFPGRAAAGQSISVQIHPLGEAGERGTATFTQEGPNVLVDVHVTGTPDAMQLVHIHAGPCSHPGSKTIYMLNPVQNGHSISTLQNVNLQQFKTQGYTIGLHTVRAHVSTHAACGGPIK